MALIDRYLELALQQKASDLHFSSAQPVRLRIHGDLVPLEGGALTNEQIQTIFFEILGEEEREKFLKTRNLDKSYSLANVGNFRVNLFQTRDGISAVLRTIPSKIPTIQQLGLPEIVIRLTELNKGLVLVTGPTGSGKSTTLAAMINHINTNFPYHILTAEDPVEFVHPSLQSLINQREIGSSCPTFADALKYALREDPDVILVGEMRDLETIGLALTAAETGHLVFGTLHTRGAAASVDRIIDSFPANQQAMIRAMLADSLAAVISQGLLKRADGNGRVAAYEIMVVNHAISNLIREGKTFQIQSIIQTARKEGMILMDQHIKEMMAKNIVTREEASAYLEDGGTKKSPLALNTSAPTKPSPLKIGVATPPVLSQASVAGTVAPPPMKVGGTSNTGSAKPPGMGAPVRVPFTHPISTPVATPPVVEATYPLEESHELNELSFHGLGETTPDSVGIESEVPVQQENPLSSPAVAASPAKELLPGNPAVNATERSFKPLPVMPLKETIPQAVPPSPVTKSVTKPAPFPPPPIIPKKKVG